jgi:hypothetical protein
MTPDLSLICLDESRRRQVRVEGYNGLDYIEVGEDPHYLSIFFLDRAPDDLVPANFRITGGQRVRNIGVVAIDVCRQADTELDDCVVLTVDKPGDFSTYRLCIVALDDNGRPTDQPYPRFDPRYACLDFGFRVDCPNGLDCQPAAVCPPEVRQGPEINYLAKDYASFRQLILDRLAVIMPEWQESHVPDLEMALVELLAYTGDYLSYYQDAVATEAYLETARQRISVRRHARLVDYQMHEGCNSRAWVCLQVDGNLELDPEDTAFVTGLEDVLLLSGPVLAESDLSNVPTDQYEMFEPLVTQAGQPIKLYPAHNRIRFYTWGDQECCLPKGATSATLYDGKAKAPSTGKQDDQPGMAQQAGPAKPATPGQGEVEYERELQQLQVGDYLLFEEVMGPRTGNPADADPSHRHVVCITSRTEAVDELYHQPVLEITWAEADALPFPLCVSTISDAPECRPLSEVSVACGNVVLVDHGRRIRGEDLGCVPLETTTAKCECGGRPSDIVELPGRYRPHLSRGPLTFRQPLPAGCPAAELLVQDPRRALPWIRLTSSSDSTCEGDNPGAARPADPATIEAWEVRRDLLSSGPGDRHVVAEVDDEGLAHLRFGDGDLGAVPKAHTRFTATYRVGIGPAGNVGADAISHLVYRRNKQDGIRQVRNPLPAAGGIDPEPLAEVKLFAPSAFRRDLQRAITADDYATLVMRDFPVEVQRAAATLRWTGSWYEVLVAVDARGSATAGQALLDKIAGHLYRFRRMGHDLAVQAAHQVPLDLVLDVCVLPHYLRGHVKSALLDLFSNRLLPDGQLGFFHPDNLTFGQGIYLSTLVAAAQAVTGVESVTVKKLERLYEGPNGEIEKGVLTLGPLEVARLDNDPNYPENGRLTLDVRGGR